MLKEDNFTKKLGVIGGLGPIATSYFYDLIIKMTDAESDQEHIDLVLFSKPSIPDRTDYILKRSSRNPLPFLLETGKALEALGAENIAIPCVTAHFFYDELAKGIGVPIIHAVKETVSHLVSQGVRRAGIMATEGTIYSNLFQKELLDYHIIPVVPTKEDQSDISELIYRCIKPGMPADMKLFLTVSEHLKAMGAEMIILGCTELSLVKRDNQIGPGYLDVCEVLAKCAVLYSDAKLKEEYKGIIAGPLPILTSKYAGSVF